MHSSILLLALNRFDCCGFGFAVAGFWQQTISVGPFHPQRAGLLPLYNSSIADGQLPNVLHVPGAPLRATWHGSPSFLLSPYVKCSKTSTTTVESVRNISIGQSQATHSVECKRQFQYFNISIYNECMSVIENRNGRWRHRNPQHDIKCLINLFHYCSVVVHWCRRRRCCYC